MPTILTKSIKRQMIAPVTLMGRTKTLIVELEPGDILTFREKGKRTRYSVPLASCFVLSIIAHMQEEHAAKVERAKLGRGRKPRPINFNMFSKHLLWAMSK